MLLALPLADFAQATGTISGRVYNPATGEYIRNAEVRIQGTQISATTEDGGYYTLKVTRHFEAFVSGRNAFNSGTTWFFKNSDGRIRQMERYGGQWTVGLRGNF